MMKREKYSFITSKQKIKILLIDNDRDFLTLIQQNLRLEGYSTAELATIDDVIHFVPSFSPHMILCGTFFASYLREIVAKIRVLDASITPKVIILSNQGTREEILDAIKFGADDYISQKVSPEMMIIAIEASLNSKK